ncbi:MAG: hypothetical protein JWO78_1163 [Micavibrio sp.]|nr:hypothetical protein [Micavibrio sp.]
MQNAQNFNTMALDKRWVNLMGAMNEVRRELKTLAPHPNRPGRNDPVFVRDTRGASNDDDAMANMVLGMALSHFAVAAGMPQWAENVNVLSAIDVYDAWQNDTKSDRTNGEGTEGYQLGNKGAIRGGFNMNTTHRPVRTDTDAVAWEAYLQDLPKRRVVEQSLAAMNRDADRREREILQQHKQIMKFSF